MNPDPYERWLPPEERLKRAEDELAGINAALDQRADLEAQEEEASRDLSIWGGAAAGSLTVIAIWLIVRIVEVL